MNYENLINKRKSTRDFNNQLVDEKKLTQLMAYFNQSKRLVQEIEIEAILYKQGDEVFKKLDGIAGYNGKMIHAPSYIVLASENKKGYIENTGFVGEAMILKAVDLNIDTCWITFPDSDTVKDALALKTDKEITGIIAVGHAIDKKKILHTVDTGGNYSKADMQVIEDNTSFRHGVEHIVFDKEWEKPIDYEDLEMRGLASAFGYARLAPSTLNQQPWRFILDDSIVVLTIKEDAQVKPRDEQLDAGIVMLYFYLIMSEIYDLKWHLDLPQKFYQIPKGYKIIGWVRL